MTPMSNVCFNLETRKDHERISTTGSRDLVVQTLQGGEEATVRVTSEVVVRDTDYIQLIAMTCGQEQACHLIFPRLVIVWTELRRSVSPVWVHRCMDMKIALQEASIREAGHWGFSGSPGGREWMARAVEVTFVPGHRDYAEQKRSREGRQDLGVRGDAYPAVSKMGRHRYISAWKRHARELDDSGLSTRDMGHRRGGIQAPPNC